MKGKEAPQVVTQHWSVLKRLFSLVATQSLWSLKFRTESVCIPHSPPQPFRADALFLNLSQTCPIWGPSDKWRKIFTNLKSSHSLDYCFPFPELKKSDGSAVGKTIHPRVRWLLVLEPSHTNSFHSFVCTGMCLHWSNCPKCFAKALGQQLPQLNNTSCAGKSIFPVFPTIKVITSTQGFIWKKTK